ncbi:MAG: PAS domain S-box protein [Bacteroidales bacterium]
MIGQTCHHFWADASKPCENCPSIKALQTKKTESTIMHLNDGRVWEERSEPIFDSAGNLIGVVEIATDITDRRLAEYENARTQRLLEDSQQVGKIGGWEISIDTMELHWTKEMYTIHEVDFPFDPKVDERINFYTPESLPVIDKAVQRAIEFGEPFEVDLEIITAKGNKRSIKTIGKADLVNRRIYGLFQDITERRQAEKFRELSRDLLKLLNKPNDLAEAMNGVLSMIKERTGFGAVGIRLKAGEDFPYWQQQGFSPDFLLTENSLLERTADGNVCRDQNGNVNLECTCGLVISGKTDPTNPLFTKEGSCWTNNSIPLLNLPAEEDPRHHPRNNCIHNGYASVALVPIRTQDEIIGLIQLNDHRKNCFTLEIVELLEDVASHIGAALQRIQDADLLKISNRNFKDLSTQLEAILDHIPGLIFYKDKLNNFIRVNKYMAESYHIKKEILEGINLAELHPAPLANQYHQDDLAVINSGVAKLNFEESWDTAEGLKWVNTSKIPFIDGNGEIIGIIGISMDITNYKEAQVALAQSQKELKAIYDSSPVMMCIVNETRSILFANPAFTTLTGAAEEQLKGGQACGVFGCINSYENISGCGYGTDCHNCGLRLAMDDTFKTGSSHENIEYHRTLIQNGETRVVTLLGSTAIIQSTDERKLLLCLNDITDRKKAEEAKRKSDLLLREAGRLAKLGGWEIDLATTKLSWTEETYHIHQIATDNNPSLEDGIRFYAPEAQPILNKAIDRAIKEGEPFDLELPFISAKGKHLWVRSIGNVERINSVATRLYGVFQDITERKQTEKALRENEEKYRTLVENSLVGVVQTNLKGEVLYVNDSFVKMYEATSAEEFIGAQMTGVYKYEHDRNEVLSLLKKDGRVDNFEVVGLTVKGNEKTRLLSAKVSGEVINGLVFDISERKQTEEELRKANSYLENLINYANAPIIVWDPQFRITRFNHAFEDLTGLKEPNVLGKSIELLFAPANINYSMDLIRKTQSGERWETVEIEIQHLDGSSRTVLWNSATLFDPDNKTPIATIAQGQEITQRKQAEEKIKVKNQELEKLNTEKDKFFSIIAHDLRGPFNGFLGLTEIMATQLNSLSLTELLNISVSMNKSANNLFNLLNNLLEWSRMQQGLIYFEPTAIPLLPYTTSVLKTLMEPASKKGIAINIDIPDAIQVLADENMLASTIRNIASNAVKFTSTGGKVSITAKPTIGNKIEISVKDTGIGMDAEMLENMFKLDVSISRKGTDGEPSTGLGLLLCKDFIEKHGGRIWAESEVGKGSIFSFVIRKTH